MKKYKAKTNWVVIDEVEVDSETEKFVVIDGTRCAKENSYERYYDTYQEAKQYHVDAILKKIATLKDQTIELEAKLIEANRL